MSGFVCLFALTLQWLGLRGFATWVATFLGNSGLCWTVFARNMDTAVPAERNGDLQTLICVLVARPRWCPTLSNPVPWQNWMAAYLGYTLWMKTLFRGWPVMVHDTHTRIRSGFAPSIIVQVRLSPIWVIDNMRKGFWWKLTRGLSWGDVL